MSAQKQQQSRAEELAETVLGWTEGDFEAAIDRASLKASEYAWGPCQNEEEARVWRAATQELVRRRDEDSEREERQMETARQQQSFQADDVVSYKRELGDAESGPMGVETRQAVVLRVEGEELLVAAFDSSTGILGPEERVQARFATLECRCSENAVSYVSDGALGHGFECGSCGRFLQAG